MAHHNWTHEELLRALALYCQISFGKMHSKNPAVRSLAESIGRTPSAVALKLVNFASLDPELRGRGVGGMSNTSAADREIWAEYYGKWDVLAEHVDEDAIPARSTDDTATEAIPAVPPTGPSDVMREVRLRRGQSFFRTAVLAAYDGKCCITGITSTALLRASHIVPWAHDANLRLDPRNGLCLNALHDAAFDRGLITLSSTNTLRVSKRLKEDVPQTVYSEMFEDREDRPIALPERFGPLAEALEFHRANIFKD